MSVLWLSYKAMFLCSSQAFANEGSNRTCACPVAGGFDGDAAYQHFGQLSATNKHASTSS